MALTIDKYGVPARETHSHMKGTGGITHELSAYHFFRCVRLPEAKRYISPLLLLLAPTDVKKRRKKMPLLGEAPMLGAILILLARSASAFTEHFNKLASVSVSFHVFLKLDATLKFTP
jgi:hypothetical protein